MAGDDHPRSDGGQVPGDLPVDADIDLRFPRQRRELREAPWAVLTVIAVGGAIGALARFGVDATLPYEFGQFAYATLAVNITGCLLLGALMVVVTDLRPHWRLARPFFGVGILGGYTTFSTHILDAQHLLSGGAPVAALSYLAATLLGSLAAVWCGISVAELAVRRGVEGRRCRAVEAS